MRALLLSGGIESSSLAYLLKPELLLFINYGQVCSKGEWNSSLRVAKDLGIPLEAININLKEIGSGSLNGEEAIAIAPAEEWWPFRNQMLATIAASWGLNKGVRSLIFGTIYSDNFHKDGTKEFYDLLSSIFKYQEGNISIDVPAINMNSIDLVKLSKIPRDILVLTHSCHVNNFACGFCRGCRKHYQTIEQLGIDY